MTTRYNQPNRPWQIFGNSFTASSNSNMSFSAKDGSGTMVLTNSSLLLPFGVSNERPVPAQQGMLRYNTFSLVLEYYNGTQWVSISPPPAILSVSPLSVPVVDASVVINGANLGISTPSIAFIGQDSIERSAASVTAITPNIVVKAVLPTSVIDNSNQEPFAVKLTNNDSGLFTISTAPNVIDINSPVSFITGNDLGDVSNNTTTISLDVSGKLIIVANDPEALPISWNSNISTVTSNDLSLNLFNGSTAYITGTLTNPGADTTYNFNVTVTDSASNVSTKAFLFQFIVPKAQSLSVTSTSNWTQNITYLDASYNSIGGPIIGGFTIYKFSCTSGASAGTATITPILTNGAVPTTFTDVSYVLVAGGGGGGANVGGGGGAGGVLLGTLASVTGSNALSIGQYGAGGLGSNGSGDTETKGGDGGNTTGFSLTALGGGGGGAGSYSGTPGGSAANGGSGGGEGVINDPSGPGTGTAPQGNNGGQGNGSFPGGAGGGGGYSSVGASTSGNTGGNGGSALDIANFLGVASSLTTVYSGGGGGGGNSNSPAAGGAGGSASSFVVGGQGGTASGDSGAGSAAVVDTGSGGGGGSANYWTGGNGSSGALFVRFPSFLETLT